MISIISFFFFVHSVLSQPIFNFRKFDLPSTSVGPFSVAFDRFGRGPFTGISDGRIVRYDPLQGQFMNFAFTSPNRSKAMCDGTNNNNDAIMGAICGRPLGLAFYFKTNQMYISDAYRGLLMAEPNGRLAANIATAAEGVPFKLPFHLDVDQATGDVYFTDFSSQFDLSQLQAALAASDSMGRLLKYKRGTGEVTVLLRNLSGAAGVVISHDKTYLLVSEYVANRTSKFWLSGPNAFMATDLVTFEGGPHSIERNSGLFLDYWAAVNRAICGANGAIIRIPTAVRFTGDGRILQTVDL